MKGIKENSWAAWALQIFITEGLRALETRYYRFLLWSGAMLFTHHCAQGHDVTYIFINPKYQAEIYNKVFNVSSLIIREEPSLWVLTLLSLVAGARKKSREGSALGYIFSCVPETRLVSSQPKFFISLCGIWLLLGDSVAFERNRNWNANWYDVSSLLCKILICHLTQSGKAVRSKNFGFKIIPQKKYIAGKERC